MNEIHNDVDTQLIILTGSDNPIIIDKLYGPTGFAQLRITADGKSGNWVIERDFLGAWIPWCEIPGQITEEYVYPEFSSLEKRG